MFRTTGGARGRAVLALSATLGALALLGACSFPDAGGGTSAKVEPLPSPSAPAAGVQDPATQAQFSKFYQQRVDWTACSRGFTCAQIRVPLDWAAPDGPEIKIVANRLKASGKRIGSLVINPGGPGASGVEFATAANQVFSKSILSSYDIIGFDPRGIGLSDPVKCLSDSQLAQYFSKDGTPDTAAELAASVEGQTEFAQACEQNTGALLGHVDTISTVKDLDVLRAILGDDVLSFYGASYGTFIGAWYAELFPWRVGRMTLDGAVDPDLTAAQYVDGQAEGFTRVLKAFVSDCQSQSGCPLSGSVEQGLTQIGTLVAKADTTPLRTKDASRPLTQNLMTTGIIQGLYATQLWPVLRVGLTNAISGDGTQLLALADSYLERDSKGHYGQINSANPAIFCLDKEETRTPEQIAADAAEVQKKFPPLGGTIAWSGISCENWPYKQVVPTQKLTAEGAAPILVLGTIDDPATPYEWAQSLASQLSSGHLVTWNGSVHTAYRKGSECVDNAVDAYFLSGAVPAKGLRCD